MLDPRIVIPDAIALVVCGIAVATDLRRHRIPNQLTFAGAACGLARNLTFGAVSGGPAGGLQWLLASAAGAALGLVVFGLPAALGLVGMGDVKLVVAIGALVRWPLALPLALYIALAGGVLALGYAARGGRARAVARNLRSLGTREAALHRMPYGLAIAIGCAAAVASRYVEALRLLEL
jgi:prepilin peptidase CpaA